MNDELITLVIHTSERAGILKNILESHGMNVVLEDFVVSHSTLRVAQRVKIKSEDLPLALRILESGDNYSATSIAMKMAGMSGNLLIPVDFSDSSLLAVKMGFELARRLSVHPVVMHAYVAPLFAPGSPFAPDGAPDPVDPVESEELEMKEIADIRSAASRRLAKFKNRIDAAKKEGYLPNVKYSTTLLEGVAEEVILNYCRETPPLLVVMATRGVTKKEEELIGSVTAEVLDSCRVPVLTVPENYPDIKIEDIKRLMMFCNVDQHDVLAIDTLMRMFGFPKCEVVLVPVHNKTKGKSTGKIDDMCEYLKETYPEAEFKSFIPDASDFRKQIDKEIGERGIQLLIVPNKKTNIFSRIFHPTIAHRFLFERDMAMLALPV